MTREEAIECLISVIYETKTEAINMAIKALEQEPQKIGYWVFPNSATKMICTCSCCGGDGNAFGKDKFCRTCGAKMESEG